MGDVLRGDGERAFLFTHTDAGRTAGFMRAERLPAPSRSQGDAGHEDDMPLAGLVRDRPGPGVGEPDRLPNVDRRHDAPLPPLSRTSAAILRALATVSADARVGVYGSRPSDAGAGRSA